MSASAGTAVRDAELFPMVEPAEADRALVAISDEQALAWLAQREATVETTIAELARIWGWNRTKVLRRLRRWNDAGHLAREIGPAGKSLIRVNTTVHQTLGERTLSVRTDMVIDHDRSSERPPERRGGRIEALLRLATGSALVAIGGGIAFYGLRINAWYGATLGRTPEAASLLSGLSMAADALAFVLPTVASALWTDRRHVRAVAAWAAWAVTIAISILAAVGFAAVNVADTSAARSKIAGETSGLQSRIERMRAERGAISETRAAAAVKIEIEQARAAVPAWAWEQTGGCINLSDIPSSRACSRLLRQRTALTAIERRGELDRELIAAEHQLSGLPAVSSADPQGETAANLLVWISGGMVGATPGDIQMARVLGMTLLPQLSGVVFMLAFAMWRRPAALRSAR